MTKTLVPALLISAGLLGGCAMTGPSNLKVHEALLYGATQERIVWVYGTLSGPSSSVKLGDTGVDLRRPVQDPLTVPGTLSVNGKATYRLPTAAVPTRLAVTRRGTTQFSVTPTNPAELSAVYYTDGTSWVKLGGTSGIVTATPVNGLQGAGNLTDAEAGALSTALLGQGNLAVGVIDETTAPDRPLTIEPKPEEYQRTALYVLPNVATVTGTGPTAGTPLNPTPTTPVAGATVNFTELGSGSQASVPTYTVQIAATQPAANTLYSQAYGNQSAAPSAPAVGNGTIVGVFLGQRPTGGYSVKVVRASAANGVLTLVVRVGAPGPGSIVTQALTSPWTLVRVEGRYSQVQLVDERGQPLQPGVGPGQVR